MFDIIFDNLIPPKFKFKLHSLGQYTTLSFEEVKKIHSMSKYQIKEMLKEKRITKMDEFISSFEPNARQYYFLTKFCKNQYTEIYEKILKAVQSINDGRNWLIEALAQLDSLNYLTEQINVFTPEQSKEAAKFFIDNRLGFDFTPFQMWKYKKQEKEIKFTYDPR
mmetsp:Transcript_13228/g.15327  ORF Transcript_13228/g.15327 Transcript_13228/m.15327 type:complete len:165 (-) Transcript_13228:140-634(-)